MRYPSCGRHVCPPTKDLRPCVAEFARAMEKVLRENDHKGGWDDCTLAWLGARMVQEVGELLEILAYKAREIDGSINEERVLKEAADVANFAMMIWDRCREKKP